MKQSDNPEEFFKKYGFTMYMKEPHPIFKDMMEFEGLEAKYVSELEHKVRDLEKYINYQNDKIDFLMNRDLYLLKEKLK
jgi:hypothetical protein